MEVPRKRKTWNPANMKKAFAALKSGEMGYQKASKQFNVPKSTLERYVKKSLKSSDGPAKRNSVDPFKLSEPCTISETEKTKAPAKRKTWSAANMKKAYAALKSGQMGYQKASKRFNVPKTTLEHYVKSSKSFDELVNTRLGRKHIFDAEVEQILADCCIEITKRTCYALRRIDIRTLAYQLAKKHNIRNPFRDIKGEAGQKWCYGFLKRHPQLSSIRSLSIPGPWPKRRTGERISEVGAAIAATSLSDFPIPSISSVHLTGSPSVQSTSEMSLRSNPSKDHLEENLQAVTSFSKLLSPASKQKCVATLLHNVNEAVSSSKLMRKKASRIRRAPMRSELVFPRKQALKRKSIIRSKSEVPNSSSLHTSSRSIPGKLGPVSARAEPIKEVNTMQPKPEVLVARTRGRPRKGLAVSQEKQAILKGNRSRSMPDVIDSPSLYKTTRSTPKMSDSASPTKQPIIKANGTRSNPTTLISSPQFKNPHSTPKRSVPVSPKKQVIKTRNMTRSKAELVTPLPLTKTSRSTPKKTVVLTKKQEMETANRRQPKSELLASRARNTCKKSAPVVPRAQATKKTNRQQSRVEVLTLPKLHKNIPRSGSTRTSKKSPMQTRKKEKIRQTSKKQNVSKQETKFQGEMEASKKQKISQREATFTGIKQISKKQKVSRQETNFQGEMEANTNEDVILEIIKEEPEEASHEEEYIVPEPHFEIILVDYADFKMDELNNIYGWSNEECVVDTNIDEYN